MCYGAAHPQAFVSCLKARLSEENIFCIDCFELRLEIIRSSSVTFFHPKLYHILPVVHIVILNISALYNFICIIAKYIQPPNRDWMENVWRQKKRKFFSGMSFSISMIAFCFWGNKRQIWTIDDRKLWMGATLLKSPSLCLSEWIGGRPRKDLHKSQFFTSQWKPLIQLALCLWMYKYNCAGECEIAKRIWRQTWKGIHYGHFFTSAPFNETSPLTLFGSRGNLLRQKFCIMNFLSGGFSRFFSWVFKLFERRKKKTRFSVRNMPRRKSKFTSESSWDGLDCLRSWADTFSITATQNVVKWILYTLDI